MKGYFVQHHGPAKDASEGQTVSKNRKATTATIEKAESPIESDVLTLTPELPAPLAGTSASAFKSGQKKSEITLTPSSFIINPIQSFTALKKHIEASPAAGEALSMLWLLAVVLLVVYVAGLLLGNTGGGWLIHLLLVAALVVFILWILRII